MSITVYLSCCGGDKMIAVVEEAMKQARIEGQADVVSDFLSIAKAGIVSLPAVKIDGRVVASGRIPTVSALVRELMNARASAV